MKYLVIELAFPGDVIVSLALSAEIKRLEPSANITYLVRPDAVEIARACTSVDSVEVFDKRGADAGDQGLQSVALGLNRLGYDAIFLLHGSERSQRLCKLLDAQIKCGFESMAHASLTNMVRDEGWSNRYERAILPLRSLRSGVNLQTLPRLNTTPLKEVDEFIGDSQTIALAPGSMWPTKQWGSEKFATLASSLSKSGVKIILIGGKADFPDSNVIANAVHPSALLNLVGRTSMLQSAYGIEQSQLLIANDSAPGHLAVAVGTPVLTIFGPTVPEFGFAPPKGSGETIGLDDLWCRPCTSHGSRVCPIYSHACMQDLASDAVLRAALSMTQRNSIHTRIGLF